MQDKLLGAEATAQERVNVIQQSDLNKRMAEEQSRLDDERAEMQAHQAMQE